MSRLVPSLDRLPSGWWIIPAATFGLAFWAGLISLIF